MTIREAVNQRVKRVRLPQWPQDTVLELTPLSEGYGPWATLRMNDERTSIFLAKLLADREDCYEVIE